MATIVTVHLADLPKSIEAETATGIKTTLQGYFDTTVSAQKLGASVSVVWSNSAPTLTGSDLLCYFVRSYSDSIIAGGMVKGQTASKDDAGLTLYTTAKVAGSEVYINKVVKPAHAARLALHELMHNMALTGNAMHKPGMSIGAATVMDDAALSEADQKWIAKHLIATRRTQWADGYSAYNDPLRGT